MTLTLYVIHIEVSSHSLSFSFTGDLLLPLLELALVPVVRVDFHLRSHSFLLSFLPFSQSFSQVSGMPQEFSSSLTSTSLSLFPVIHFFFSSSSAAAGMLSQNPEY